MAAACGASRMSAPAPPLPPARRAVVWLLLLLVRVADTGYALLAKWCLDEHASAGSALAFGLYRNAGAVPLMFFVAAATEGCAAPPLRDLPHLALLAATGVFASQARTNAHA